MGRLLGPKMGNGINCFSQEHSVALPQWESNQGFPTFRLLTIPTIAVEDRKILGMQDLIFPKSNQICPNLINFAQKILLGDATSTALTPTR